MAKATSGRPTRAPSATGQRSVSEDRRPLRGVRIVDFTWVWAGPYATMLLAMLGAEVIRVESMHRLDPARLDRKVRLAYLGRDPADIPAAEVEKSFWFHGANLSKRSVRLNLGYPEAREMARQLVRVSDVVTENYSPGVAKRLGLDYETLRKLRPDLVMMSTSARGQSGPESHYVGYATIFNAVSGMAHLTGYPDLPPADVRDGSDMRVATTGAFALLAAIRHQRATGEGQHIDLSACEALTSLTSDAILDFEMNGRVQTRAGNRDDIMAPHNCYPCKGKDRWISIAVGSEEEWRGLCAALGRDDLLTDERFSDAFLRWRHQTELDAVIAQVTIACDATELMHVLQKRGVAAAPSMNAKDIFTDPHLKEWGAVKEIDHPVTGRMSVVATPWRFSESEVVVKRAPLIGEHTDYVFGELMDVGATDIALWAEKGVMA